MQMTRASDKDTDRSMEKSKEMIVEEEKKEEESLVILRPLIQPEKCGLKLKVVVLKWRDI